MPREYKLRMPVAVKDATSANVAAWIDEALKSGGALKADPGSGEEAISLRLDPEKVTQLANKKNERVYVTLRRLIATRCDLPAAEPREKSAGAVAADALPEKVLPRKLEYTAEDMLKVVRGMDKGLAMAYRRVYGLKELEAADTPEEDRGLAEKMAECVNRRAPKWMVENADLVKLTFALMHWTTAQTDELERKVANERGPHPSKMRVVTPIVVNESPAAAAATPSTEEITEAMHEPVQAEGEFN